MSSGPPAGVVSYTQTASSCGIARDGDRSAPQVPGVWGTLGWRFGWVGLGSDGTRTVFAERCADEARAERAGRAGGIEPRPLLFQAARPGSR